MNRRFWIWFGVFQAIGLSSVIWGLNVRGHEGDRFWGDEPVLFGGLLLLPGAMISVLPRVPFPNHWPLHSCH
jgi:hypothetical protein